MELKRMTFKAEIKADAEKEGIISGYGSVFGVVDSYGDVVEKGAFSRSIQERGMPVMLWQHNSAEPIGVYRIAREDENGLLLEGELNLDVEKGREAYALLKQGAIKGMSIGYRTVKSFQDKENIRHLTDVELYEVSLVTFPANEAANVDNVKADLPKTEREFEVFLRDAGFSRSQAKAIVAKGFRHSHADQRDAEEAGEVIDALKQALCILEREKQNAGGSKDPR